MVQIRFKCLEIVMLLYPGNKDLVNLSEIAGWISDWARSPGSGCSVLTRVNCLKIALLLHPKETDLEKLTDIADTLAPWAEYSEAIAA